MLIKSSTVLRNNYDDLVKLAQERQEPIYITRQGEGEMVFISIAQYERREAECKLMMELLAAEQKRLAGAPTYTTDELRGELRSIYAES